MSRIPKCPKCGHYHYARGGGCRQKVTDNDDLALVCDHHYKAMRKAAKKYLGHSWRGGMTLKIHQFSSPPWPG